jgi:hypothetical protein
MYSEDIIDERASQVTTNLREIEGFFAVPAWKNGTRRYMARGLPGMMEFIRTRGLIVELSHFHRPE